MMKENKIIEKILFVDPAKVIRRNSKNQLLVGDSILSDREIRSLQEEIKYIKATRAWDLVMNFLTEQAKLIMFEQSVSFEDMRTGKAMLLTLRILRKLFNLIEGRQTKEDDKEIEIINKGLK